MEKRLARPVPVECGKQDTGDDQVKNHRKHPFGAIGRQHGDLAA